MSFLGKFTPQNFRKGILIFEKLLILLSAMAAYLGMIALCYPAMMENLSTVLILAFVYLAIFVLLFNSYGCQQVGVLRLKELLFSFALTTVLADILSYFILVLASGGMLVVWPFFALLGVQLAVGMLLYIVANKTYFSLNPAYDTVVICANSKWEAEIIAKFRRIPERYNISQVLYEQAEEAEMFFAIDHHDTVILGDIAQEKREKILNYCFEKNRRLYLLPTVQDIMLNNASVTQIGDTMALLCKNRPVSMEQLAIKRLADVFISVVALTVLSPVLAIVALLIKLYDGGPVMFRQKRYTRNNEVFTLIKFRSMIVDAEKDGAQFTVPGDKRITPIGKFIRATRIDELPQLLNVLRGDMSIVGPRAERLENADAYTEMMPEFRYRTKVKAGLTGYAQVYGKYNTSFEDKVRMDLYYIENYSLLLDLKLLLYTIKVIFMKESTEGFENETLQEELHPEEPKN